MRGDNIVKKIIRFKDIPKLTSAGSYQINVPLEDVPVQIKKWQENDSYNLQLCPDFQRGHIWSKEQQISYIEYLLRGGTSAKIIYFNKPSWHGTIKYGYDDFVCVDGLQRLTAVLKFMNNDLQVFGSYYHDFEDRIPFSIDILFNVNNLKTEKEVLQWYVDINTSGTPHTDEEIEKVKDMIKKIG